MVLKTIKINLHNFFVKNMQNIWVSSKIKLFVIKTVLQQVLNKQVENKTLNMF